MTVEVFMGWDGNGMVDRSSSINTQKPINVELDGKGWSIIIVMVLCVYK